ncbi:hypothetical protein GCM10022393_03840 [Aquimarina addita]|uniref:Uncharacterized protein n=1 Tax=Aquimarina addita TaxID=870485 RepID=A0ABP7XBN5_9FLAO
MCFTTLIKRLITGTKNTFIRIIYEIRFDFFNPFTQYNFYENGKLSYIGNNIGSEYEVFLRLGRRLLCKCRCYRFTIF